MPEYKHSAQENPTQKQDCPRWLVLLLGPLGLVAAFLWGFTEGTLFFIVPDVLLTLTALFSLKKALIQLLATTVGALLAGVLMFSWSSQDYPTAYEAVISVPYVNETMKNTVHEHFDTHSTTDSLLRGSFSGIPYKLYAIEAPSRTDLLSFMLATIPARSARFLIGIIFFATIGYWQRKRIHKNLPLSLIGHGISWIIFYAIYWNSI